MTTTAYMYGVFNSRISAGNINFNKMMTNTRNPLNILKTSWQRIYGRIRGIYRLLAMPSLFEIGFYVRWYYKTDDDLIIITNYASSAGPEIRLECRSEEGKSYSFLATGQISMGPNEYEHPFTIRQEGNAFTIRTGDKSPCREVYPDLCYRMKLAGAEFRLAGGRIFLEGAWGIPPPWRFWRFLQRAAGKWPFKGACTGKTGPLRNGNWIGRRKNSGPFSGKR